MDQSRIIAVIGDFNPQVIDHQSINGSFVLFHGRSDRRLRHEWISTDVAATEKDTKFRKFAGFWCAPASPYKSTEGAMRAIRFARENKVPFLGTCGGFQHAILEFARNVLGLDASHEEIDPSGNLLLLRKLACPLVEKPQRVSVTNREAFLEILGAASSEEPFHCSFGINPELESIFEGSDLQIVARAESGEPRAFRLKNHPFFVGTLFQPERRALTGSLHPIVRAFLSAATSGK